MSTNCKLTSCVFVFCHKYLIHKARNNFLCECSFQRNDTSNKVYLASHEIHAHNGNCNQTTPRFAVECSQHVTGVSRGKKAQTTVYGHHIPSARFKTDESQGCRGNHSTPCETKCICEQLGMVYTNDPLSSPASDRGLTWSHSDSCIAQRVARDTEKNFFRLNQYFAFRIFQILYHINCLFLFFFLTFSCAYVFIKC